MTKALRKQQLAGCRSVRPSVRPPAALPRRRPLRPPLPPQPGLGPRTRGPGRAPSAAGCPRAEPRGRAAPAAHRFGQLPVEAQVPLRRHDGACAGWGGARPGSWRRLRPRRLRPPPAGAGPGPGPAPRAPAERRSGRDDEVTHATINTEFHRSFKFKFIQVIRPSGSRRLGTTRATAQAQRSPGTAAPRARQPPSVAARPFAALPGQQALSG